MNVTHIAPRSQNTPHLGARPGIRAEPGPQRSDRSLRRSSGNTLGAPSLADASAEAIDGRTLRFLLKKSLARKKEEDEERRKVEEKEKLKAVKEEEEHPDGWLQAFDSDRDLYHWHRRTRRAKRSPPHSASSKRKRKKRKKRLPRASSLRGARAPECSRQDCW